MHCFKDAVLNLVHEIQSLNYIACREYILPRYIHDKGYSSSPVQ